MFLRFFEQKGHKIVHSSSLVPANDPTLLFTNAGMNQFKDVFLGLEKRDYSRATSSQKCVRAGGKHNDLENVGFTRRHLTFFEMLGNFSFGDYFKREAIQYAWEFLTSPEWFNLPKNQLYVTIFAGAEGIPRDDEAEQYWLEVGVPKERILALGMKDNFWQMGDTGPCGPSSEIVYERAEVTEYDKSLPFGEDDARYVEIWNLVFMQFDRSAVVEGGKTVAYKLTPLPKPSIDTGMGLERVASVLQGVSWIYETDLFTPLIKRAAELCNVHVNIPGEFGIPRTQDVRSESSESVILSPRLLDNPSLRIIADHSRAASFLISDGVLPSNEGRGYVLRKIIRRAIRHGRALGQEKPFLYDMVFAVRDLMKDAYPELVESAERVSKSVKAEEHQFARVVSEGSRRFDVAIAELLQPLVSRDEVHLRDIAGRRATVVPGTHHVDFDQMLGELQSGDPGAANTYFVELLKQLPGRKFSVTIPGDKAFHIFETYGLPLDFMTDAARDLGLVFDLESFESAKSEEQARARASWKGGGKATASPVYSALPKTIFEGYRQTRSDNCEVVAIIKNENGAGIGARELKPGERGEIVLDHTPFYAEAGGQVGDVGWLYAEDHNTLVAEVEGVTYPVQGVRAHRVIAEQPIHVGDRLDAVVNDEVRLATMRNHTGTHLVHAALRQVLGNHVKQAGSLVDPSHLRFDFSHFTAVGDEELQDIEDLANKEVLRNDRVEVIEDVPIDVAINEYRAMALFGEKYGDRVRVIRIGDFSTELCGGTHTAATGEIGLIKILKEGSVSSGVRRLEAVTGEGSLRHFRKDHQLENVVATLVRGGDDESPAQALKRELERREEELKKLRKELDQARMKSASSSVASAAENVREVKGVKVLATRADNLERPQLRTLIDNLRNKLGSGVVVLGSV
ncbi:MAG TPA: alanine--tRNA ligase, partial [Terriglobales bacterium]